MWYAPIFDTGLLDWQIPQFALVVLISIGLFLHHKVNPCAHLELLQISNSKRWFFFPISQESAFLGSDEACLLSELLKTQIVLSD